LPHIAVVHTEDLSLFEKVPYRRNLTILPTEEVLGRAMDRRRRLWGISRKDYRYWINRKGVHGWFTQQLVKLACARIVGTESYLCLDAETFFVRRISREDFISSDGRVHLFETTDDLDVEMAEWYAHSLRFLGVDQRGVVPRRFTHSPVPMHRDIVLDMQRHIEDRHAMPWMDAMVGGDRITEYTTYGTYARHVDAMRRVCSARPEMTLYYWWKEDAGPDGEIADDLATRLQGATSRMVLVNSNMGLHVNRYRFVAERLWRTE